MKYLIILFALLSCKPDEVKPIPSTLSKISINWNNYATTYEGVKYDTENNLICDKVGYFSHVDFDMSKGLNRLTQYIYCLETKSSNDIEVDNDNYLNIVVDGVIHVRYKILENSDLDGTPKRMNLKVMPTIFSLTDEEIIYHLEQY